MKRVLVTLALALVAGEISAQPCTSQVVASHSGAFACKGKPVQIFASSIPGATYHWTGPGFSSTVQNPFVVVMQPPWADFVVTATVGACVYTDTVTLIYYGNPPKPAVSIEYPPLCEGKNIFIELTSLAFEMDHLVWTPEGDLYYAPVYIQGLSKTHSGQYKAISKSPVSGCESEDTTYFTLDVIDVDTPQVSVTYDGKISPSGSTITFTATVVADTTVSYQWFRNGIARIGETASQYIVEPLTDVVHNDRIHVAVKTDGVCGTTVNSDTVSLTLNLGITSIDRDQLKVYPNPTNGVFELSGSVKPGHIKLQLYDVFGRAVFNDHLAVNSGWLHHKVDIRTLTTGTYFLQVLDNNGLLQNVVVQVVK